MNPMSADILPPMIAHPFEYKRGRDALDELEEGTVASFQDLTQTQVHHAGCLLQALEKKGFDRPQRR